MNVKTEYLILQTIFALIIIVGVIIATIGWYSIPYNDILFLEGGTATAVGILLFGMNANAYDMAKMIAKVLE